MGAATEAAFLLWSNTADIVFFNLLSVVMCLYSLHVELSNERDPNYRALCDFNEYMSCSAVLTSKYGKGFGVMHLLFGENHILNSRNCNIGLVVYLGNLFICLFLPTHLGAPLLYYSSVILALGCFYLAFVLFVILRDFCLVCVSLYVINGCLYYLTSSLYKQY